MSEKVELGRVVKVYPSGICETDKGERANIVAQIGDRLVFNKGDRKVEIVKPIEEIGIDSSEYDGLDPLDLADKFTVSELKKIAKQKGLKGYGSLNQADLCNLIATGELPKGDE
jgi:hypothetical protein